MVAYNKFEDFSEHLAEKVHDLNADTLKIYFSNATPSASADVVKADLAEITIENGYTGGVDIANSTSQTAGTTSIVAGTDPVTVTASGGSYGPLRYVPLFNDDVTTPGIDVLIGWWDYGSAVTPADAESFSTDFGASVFTIL